MSHRSQVLVAVIGTIASLLGIFAFVTGFPSLPAILENGATPRLSTQQVRSPCDPADPGNRSQLSIASAVINGYRIDRSNPIINVKPGEHLAGNVELSISSGFTYAAMAFGMTPSWGDHEAGMADFGGFSTPVTDLRRNISINLRAPATVGEHYIIFAFRGEFNAAQILSATNWTTPNHHPIWNDGDDVADWSAPKVWEAIQRGKVCAPYRERANLVNFYVPATALIVRVVGD